MGGGGGKSISKNIFSKNTFLPYDSIVVKLANVARSEPSKSFTVIEILLSFGLVFVVSKGNIKSSNVNLPSWIWFVRN